MLTKVRTLRAIEEGFRASEVTLLPPPPAEIREVGPRDESWVERGRHLCF
jgi:hypothetical protein